MLRPDYSGVIGPIYRWQLDAAYKQVLAHPENGESRQRTFIQNFSILSEKVPKEHDFSRRPAA